MLLERIRVKTHQHCTGFYSASWPGRCLISQAEISLNRPEILEARHLIDFVRPEIEKSLAQELKRRCPLLSDAPGVI
jgi:hypothetical protein